jgi:hypothetical protein
MKTRVQLTKLAALSASSTLALVLFWQSHGTAQSRNTELVYFTTPAVVVHASAHAPTGITAVSDYDVLRLGDLGDLEPRVAAVTIGAGRAAGTASLSSFSATAVTAGHHTVISRAFREVLAHDPQGRGEVRIIVHFSAAASCVHSPDEYTDSAAWGVSLGQWSRVAWLTHDHDNPSNPVTWPTEYPTPYPGNVLPLAAGGTHQAFDGQSVYARYLMGNGHTIYSEQGEGSSSTQTASASVPVVPGAAYLMRVLAVSNGNCVAVVDPVFEVDPSNPDVTLEFPNTVVDPEPQSPLLGLSPEDLAAMGIDPQPFLDLGFFDVPPTDPPHPEPPASDTTPPTTTAATTPDANLDWWNNTPVTVSLAATDNAGGTGVKELHVTLSGASSGSDVVSGATGHVMISSEGVSTVTYYAVDNAGNQEVPNTLTVRIDRTPPALSGMPAADCVLWPPDHRMVQIASIAAADSLSGPAGEPAITVTSNEPDAGLGNDDLVPDVTIEGGNVQVRAERAGNGPGRIYSITATSTDLAGNTTTAASTCIVPHDRR